MSSLTPLSGFPEFLPSEQRVFDMLKSRIEKTFQSYGYQGMETPAVEKMTTLVAKGATEQEIYTLQRYQDPEQNKTPELGLRFDLTVPLARYVAQHHSSLSFPFRRYQIAPVWRGERPQKGRYRQFYQCDIDIIGENTLSLAHDAEAISVLARALMNLGVTAFHIHLNHKKILLGAIEAFGVPENQTDAFLRLLDKKQKITAQDFDAQIAEFLSPDARSLFQRFAACQGAVSDALPMLQNLGISNALFREGLTDLGELYELLKVFGTEDKVLLQVTLARGLAYYTGVVLETFIPQALHLGSIASGGRYDGLTQHFIQRRQYPGIGLSIGLSRLFSYLLESQPELKAFKPQAKALIAVQQRQLLTQYVKFAEFLRDNSCPVEVYLQDKPLADQLKYASKRGFDIVITANDSELQSSQWFVKNIEKQQQEHLTQDQVLALLLSR